ncbi:MAG TPA: YbaN family protein [Woeseiaceae bacterium]|nr:YbaN family protein [Woeseiaceae bacterium]
MLTRAARLTWLVVGVVALALGAIGIAVPLLPTTPLILLAAFAFARSSNRLHEWLITHDVFGTLIDNWQRHGAISRRAKVLSVVSMAAVLGISLAMAAPPVVIIVQLVVLGAAALFILTRPLPPDM